MIIYNKLIRDRIPEIMAAAGKRFTIERLTDDNRYLAELNRKLGEELAEYQQDGSVAELADLAEVLCAILQQKGVSLAEFEALRQQKRAERGGFDQRLFLVSVEP